MKDPADRTKVVLRHLPVALSQSVLKVQIDARFAGRYNWFSFRPGKTSHRNQHYSRAYIDFKSSKDVTEFAQAFDGHVFVNEKGSHFKALVEYAPSQRVPRTWSKSDVREGTIFKDIEYLEFLELLAKPVDNLPSAEVQLERKEAERAGVGAKDNLIVTPLMDFVRQKRATKSGSQRSIASGGKLGRRGGGASAGTCSALGRKGHEKRRMTTATYVVRDNARTSSSKDKATYILVPRRGVQQPESDLSVQIASKMELLEDDALRNIVPTTEGTAVGGDGPGEIGKKKLLLLKKKEKEFVNGHIAEASTPTSMGVGSSPQRRQLSTINSFSSAQQTGGASNQHGVTSLLRSSPGTSNPKQNQRRDANGRIVRSILINKELRRSPQLTSSLQADHQIHAEYLHKDEKVSENEYAVGAIAVKQDRRMRNKDRPDRPVWTPRRRSDETVGSDDSHVCIHSASVHPSSDLEGPSQSQHGVILGLTNNTTEAPEVQTLCLNHMNGGVMSSSEQSIIQEENSEMTTTSRIGDTKTHGSVHNILAGDNGNHRQVMRRPSASVMKELDGSLNVSETKSPRRGGILGHGSQEKQVWVAVQKSGSGS
uniref:UPF3 domain-containing protein n=1 Tax=Araucaria cunninghamii TaxID=56994 RepID=A0A0D6QUD6_ARACU